MIVNNFLNATLRLQIGHQMLRSSKLGIILAKSAE